MEEAIRIRIREILDELNARQGSDGRTAASRERFWAVREHADPKAVA